MQRISVDLPEPDGPQMTIRSPGRTSRSMSVSTWKSPNHLSTPSMRMMTVSAPCASAAVVVMRVALPRQGFCSVGQVGASHFW